MKKPNKAGRTTVIFFRAAPDLVKQLDARVQAEREARPGVLVSRADVIRALLLLSLKEEK